MFAGFRGHAIPVELRALARDFDLGMTGPPLSYSMDFIAGGLVGMVGGLASAAVRETWEETGYLVGASTAENDALRPDHSALRFSARAITPRESPIRFHARFFLADGTALTAAPAGSGELTDLAWFPLEEARRLPVIDVTEFVLDALPRLAAGPSQMPLFAYRNGRPAVRWLGAP